jgi:galactofuranose transport system substrate-binding protein
MNSKSKLILILLVIISGLFFIKISSKKHLNTKKNQAPIIVGFAQLGSESAWRLADTESVKSAAKDVGINLVFENAEGSQEQQKQIIKDFIIQKVDVIIFPPLVATGWEGILKDAKKANIPVIIADRTIKPNNTDLYSVFVGEDFFFEGEKAAKWLIEHTNSHKKINVLELRGLAGSAPAVDRAKGFRKVITGHSNIAFIDSVAGDFIKAQGKLKMKKMLAKHGKDINVVFSHNDDMALGAIEAIKEYGLRPGKDILIISVDGGKAALQAIKDGKSNVSVECTPMLGPKLMETAIKLFNKEKVPKKIVMEEKVFTIKNVDKELPLRPY